MLELVRTISRVGFACALVMLLAACSGSYAGMNSFQSPDGRYAFLYPNGWSRVSMSGGPQVVFHDLINSDETLSLAVSKVDEKGDLQTAWPCGRRCHEMIARVASRGCDGCRRLHADDWAVACR